MTIPAPPAPGFPPPQNTGNHKKLLLIGGAGAAVVLLLCICCSIGGFLLYHFHGGGSLIGTWKSDDGGQIYEFKSDGTCTVTTGGLPLQGTYTTSGNKLTVSLTFVVTTNFEYQYAISGKTLTLTTTVNGASQSQKFTRQ